MDYQEQILKTQSRKKGKDDDLEKINEEMSSNITTNHLIPEIIADLMISKILSYVITEKKKKQISTRLGSYCFSFLREMVDQGVSTYNLTYEKDDYLNPIPLEILNQELFYDNQIDKMNTWIEIKEPNRVKQHRLTGTQINYIKPNFNSEEIVETDNENMFSPGRILRNSGVFSNFIPEKNSIIIESNSIEDINKTKSNNGKLMKNKDINISKKKTNNNLLPLEQSSIDSSKKKLNNNPLPLEKNPFKIRKDLNCHDIPSYNIIDLNNFPERKEDDQLRRDHELQLIKKKEIASREIIPEVSKLGPEKLIKIKKKLINGQKFTFDSNGEIMQYKKFNPEVLSSEFWWSKQDIKNLAVLNNSVIPNKFLLYKNILEMNQNKPLTPPDSPKPEVIEYNEEEEDTNGNNDKNNNKLFPKKKKKPLPKRTGKEFIPSGSCFDLITPETGVVFKQDDKIKEGSADFTSKYSKTSIHEYTKLLNQSRLSSNLKSKKALSSLGMPINGLVSTNENAESQPYLGYKDSIQSSINPLLHHSQQAHNTQDHSIMSSLTIPPQIVTTQVNPLMHNTNQFSPCSDSEGGSKINEKIRKLFELPMPNQKCEDGINNNIYPSVLSSKKLPINQNSLIRSSSSMSIFKTKFNNKFLLKKPRLFQSNSSFELIDSFNQNIIANKQNWGNSLPKTPIRPDFKEFHKNNNYKGSLEESIVKTKLPRERRFYHSIKNI